MPRSRSHCRIGPCVVWLLFRNASYTYRLFSFFVARAAAGPRSACSISTTMNSACCPLAVCSITHGAILLAGVTRSGGSPCVLMAREEPIAPSAAMAAATKNNEQNTRRHRGSAPARTSAKKRPVRTGRPIETLRLKKADGEVDFVFMDRI